jgi:(E)-4-hydroxy-3-methylbut-2-enyl-diphosphate synthase
MERRKTNQVILKGKFRTVKIGSNNPISVQSMTTTHTSDVKKTIEQIEQMALYNCDIVRVAVANTKDANSLKEIVNNSILPVVADIHFRKSFALKAIDCGVACVRINPGNMPYQDAIEIIELLKQTQIPCRIGVNAGSISENIKKKYGVSVKGLLKSALDEIKLFEDNGFYNFKISIKHHDPSIVIKVYNELAKYGNWPFHIGVTEAGPIVPGIVKNTIAITELLQNGIGDTLRVSLSANPVNEVKTGVEILQSLGLKKRKYEIISCPTCGRTEIDLQDLVKKVELAVIKNNINLKGAVMGCVVNGPGEAADADIGVAGGVNSGKIFVKGKPIKIVKENEIVDELIKCAQML